MLIFLLRFLSLVGTCLELMGNFCGTCGELFGNCFGSVGELWGNCFGALGESLGNSRGTFSELFRQFFETGLELLQTQKQIRSYVCQH